MRIISWASIIMPYVVRLHATYAIYCWIYRCHRGRIILTSAQTTLLSTKILRSIFGNFRICKSHFLPLTYIFIARVFCSAFVSICFPTAFWWELIMVFTIGNHGVRSWRFSYRVIVANFRDCTQSRHQLAKLFAVRFSEMFQKKLLKLGNHCS
mgnify:CR=1 FL=1